jgi:hypothetical protein
MAYGVALVFGPGVTEDDYWAVNDKLGMDRQGNGDWPEGILFHTGGPTADGGWVVMELWDKKESQTAWMTGRLGAALGAVGVPAPSQVIESNTVHHRFAG